MVNAAVNEISELRISYLHDLLGLWHDKHGFADLHSVDLDQRVVMIAALIYVLARNKDDADRKKHRAAYKKHIRQELQSPDIRTSGMVENRDAANTAWPPVDQVMDAQAAEEYQQLAAKEEAARVQPDTSQPS